MSTTNLAVLILNKKKFYEGIALNRQGVVIKETTALPTLPMPVSTYMLQSMFSATGAFPDWEGVTNYLGDAIWPRLSTLHTIPAAFIYLYVS